jgi:N-acetylneuraminate lyase
VVVHVGSTRVEEALVLARHAASHGAVAVSALAPFYVKPRSVEDLITVCAAIASAAPDLPFYFYDIPALTGVQLPMPEFLTRARDRIPNLVGLKFTNPDLIAYQSCQRACGATWDLPWGIDECLLAALAVGARGAVGSGYNFAGPLYRRLLSAFQRGDLVAAREEQYRGVQVVETLARHGYLAAAKAVMRRLGVDVGPVRAPLSRLDGQQEARLLSDLDRLGFWEWLAVARG